MAGRVGAGGGGDVSGDGLRLGIGAELDGAGGVGAINPILIVADHIGTHTLRWPLSVTYPLVWCILLISFGALAGVIGAYRTKQDHRVPVELTGR